jgi:ATP-binding cassette, subfamily B, multidrug efflux pump
VLKRLAVLWPYLRPHRRKLAIGLFTVFLSVVVGLMTPLLLGQGIDTLRRNVSRETLLGYAGVILAITFVQGVFSYLQRMLLVSMSRDIELDLRNDYFSALERQAPSFFQQHPTGDLMARATKDLEAVRLLCGPAIMYMGNTVFTAVGAIFLMARINGTLTLLTLLTMPLVAIATNVFGGRIHTLFARIQEKYADVTARVQENLAGVRVVRAYSREEAEQAGFQRLNDEFLQDNRRLIGWSAAFHPLLQALVGLGSVVVVWYGGLLVIRGAISLGEFVTFSLFLNKLIWPMIALGWVINLAQRGTASMIRIQNVLTAEPEIRDEPPLADPGEIRGAVDCRNLTFSYTAGSEPVLQGIDFQVTAGQTVALVGRTGSGKSTLLSLIPRMIDPPEGTLHVDGVDVRRIPLARLRSAIGMVPQETFLFSETIRENIALGRPDATGEEVLEAARLAGLATDLAQFPNGLETLVGERGLTLSGGQKQRVALARALLRQPRILLLDDCLSAVDTQTEEHILNNLRTVFRGRTVFLVSHRISTVKDADVILVLDHGRIIERGTHGQLLAVGGAYAELHQRQLLEEELAAV